MSVAREQGDWNRLRGVRLLGDNARVLLETLLAACDPESVFTRHVTSAQTAVAALARAQSALESRSKPNRAKAQPYDSVVLSLISVALTEAESLALVLPEAVLDDMVKTLSDIKIVGKPGVADPADCRHLATRLATQASEMRTAVLDQVNAVWRGDSTPDGIDRLAVEVAALCLMAGRWHPTLTEDVRAALAQGAVDARRLTEIILPAERTFQVAVVIEGASELESLSELMDRSSAVAAAVPGEPLSGWGDRTADLKALADLAKAASDARRAWSNGHASGHVLLTLAVRASDLGGAALLGRRQISELLDQYMAGQRLGELRLRPETLVRDPSSGRALRLAVPAFGTGAVRPLTVGWPSALRECLRTAHIARVTEAPMTAAGLCWSALEALELKPDTKHKLARALSLQAVRQQAVDLHRRTRSSVAAKVRAAQNELHAVSSRFASMDAVAPERRPAALEEKLVLARAALSNQETELKEALDAQARFTRVEAWVGTALYGRLRDVDRWLDVIAVPDDAQAELRAVGASFALVADSLEGDVGVQLRTWRELMAAPGSLAEWIEDTATRVENCLDGLYALRNIALHDGQFISSTDMLDVHAGRSLVDMTLEFMGNWYGQLVGTTSARAGWTAIEVIDHLCERQRLTVDALRGGTRAGLNVAHLTSPTSTGFDRVGP